MAQLVARFHGMEEVRGSNPLSSTIVMRRDMSDSLCPDFLLFWQARNEAYRTRGAYRIFGVGLGRVFRLAINVLSGLKFDGFNFAGGHDVLVLLRLSPGIEPKGRGPSWVPGAWL